MVVWAKYYFFEHPAKGLSLLSASDIMIKAKEVLRKPTPVAYKESYIEYPVLTGIFMTVLALFSNSARDYFFLNGLTLSFFSTASVFLARELARKAFGRKDPLIIYLTPSLIFFTFFNWDSLALFFLLSALYLNLKGRHNLAILLSSLGFWFKIFPIFSAATILINFLIEGKYRKFLKGLTVFLAISLVLNLPFALTFFKGWFVFFEFSSKRPPNIESFWNGLYLISDKFFGRGLYWKIYYGLAIDFLSYSFFIFGSLIYFVQKWKRHLRMDLVIDVVFLVSVFLLTSKVYSPQYNIWVSLVFIMIGLNRIKIYLFEFFNLAIAWSIFEYFHLVFVKGISLLPFPLLKFTYSLAVLRHLVLFLLIVEIWRLAFDHRPYAEN